MQFEHSIGCLLLALATLGAASPGPAPGSPPAAPAPPGPAAPAAATPEPTTEQALERWLAALGGRAAVESVAATYVWARIEGPSVQGRSEEWNTARGQLRSVADFNTFRRVTGFDGARGYLLDENRKRHELSGPALEILLTEVYLASGSHFFPGRRPGAVRYLGPEARDGQDFQVLEAAAAGGRPVRVYLDARTWLPARLCWVEDADTSWTHYANYRAVDGVQEAFELESWTSGVAGRTRIQVEALQHLRQPPPPEFFEPPPDTLRDFTFAPGADSAEVPFELWGDHLVVLAESHRQEGLPFLLDTGAEATHLDAGLAAAWRMTGEVPLQVQGTAGSQAGALVALDTLSLPGVALLNQRVVALNLAELRPDGRPLAGVLGYDFFSRFVVRLDFERRVMTLYDPARDRMPDERPGAAAQVLPLTLDAFAPRVQATVDDSIPVRLQLDTGAPASVVFFRGFWSAHPSVGGGAAARAVETAGVGGRSVNRQARFAALAVGRFRVEGPQGMFRESEAGTSRSREDAGLLGMGFLRRFELTLDYGRRQLGLRPNRFFGLPEPAP
ncbi:MAG TPA: retropepsin-like aspartic protease [Candidatus Saccharimonadales bacterium]|nr:retropepsin-like aspartic protease [Candidatus Saccharimonadales bacterium]